jgi:hypothetical protein
MLIQESTSADTPAPSAPAYLQDLFQVRRTWECDVCGTDMLDLHCKLRCVNCGFTRDCSDP